MSALLPKNIKTHFRFKEVIKLIILNIKINLIVSTFSRYVCDFMYTFYNYVCIFMYFEHCESFLRLWDFEHFGWPFLNIVDNLEFWAIRQIFWKFEYFWTKNRFTILGFLGLWTIFWNFEILRFLTLWLTICIIVNNLEFLRFWTLWTICEILIFWILWSIFEISRFWILCTILIFWYFEHCREFVTFWDFEDFNIFIQFQKFRYFFHFCILCDALYYTF